MRPRPSTETQIGTKEGQFGAETGVVAWLAQKPSVARTKDNVKVRKESLGFWTEETKRVGI